MIHLQTKSFLEEKSEGESPVFFDVTKRNSIHLPEGAIPIEFSIARKELIQLGIKEGKDAKISPKDLRLIQVVKKLVNEEGSSVIIFLRFVDMTKHLSRLLEKEGIPNLFVHGRMGGESQNMQLKRFKSGEVKVLFASERLIRKGTDLPEADRCIHFGTTLSIEAREQAMGRIRSTRSNLKEDITIIYHQTAEQEKYTKLVEQFLESVKSLKTSAGWTIFDDGSVQDSKEQQPDFVTKEEPPKEEES